MQYRIELKNIVSNDVVGRMPSIDTIKENIEKYAVGFNGLVVYHDTFSDFKYDIGVAYDKVDTSGVIGHVISCDIIDTKLFVTVELSEELDLEQPYICFYRSRMRSSKNNDSVTFDDISIFAIDLINTHDNDSILPDKLSKIELI